MLCAVRASTGFVPLCAVRASRASCDANLQRLSTVRAYKGFLPCEPTKAFYRASLQRLSTVYERPELCAVRASKGFLTCTSAKSFARSKPPKTLCLCVLKEPHELRAVRAYKGLLCARVQKLCAVRASKSFVPLCAVRASRAMCSASLQRLVMCSCTRTCTYVLSVRAHTIFVLKNYIIGTVVKT